MPTDRRLVAGSLAVVAAAAAFGTLGPVSRLAYDAGLEPAAFVTWRASIGALTMIAVLGLLGRTRTVPSARGIRARERLSLLVAGLAGLAINGALFTAFDVATVAVVLLGFYTYPAIVALAGAVLFEDRLGRPRLIALAMALGGMALVVGGPSIDGGGLPVAPLGLALAIVAAAAEAVYLLLNRWGHPSVPTGHASAALLIISAGGFLAWALLLGQAGNLLLPTASTGLLPLLLFAGIGAAAIPTTLNLLGTRWIGPTRTAILALTEPVVGVALAAAWLGEGLEPIQVVGGAMILAGGVLLQRERSSAGAPDRRIGQGRPAAEARPVDPGGPADILPPPAANR